MAVKGKHSCLPDSNSGATFFKSTSKNRIDSFVFNNGSTSPWRIAKVSPCLVHVTKQEQGLRLQGRLIDAVLILEAVTFWKYLAKGGWGGEKNQLKTDPF